MSITMQIAGNDRECGVENKELVFMSVDNVSNSALSSSDAKLETNFSATSERTASFRLHSGTSMMDELRSSTGYRIMCGWSSWNILMFISIPFGHFSTIFSAKKYPTIPTGRHVTSITFVRLEESWTYCIILLKFGRFVNILRSQKKVRSGKRGCAVRGAYYFVLYPHLF